MDVSWYMEELLEEIIDAMYIGMMPAGARIR